MVVPGKNARQVTHIVGRIGFDRLPPGVKPGRAIHVQVVKAHRKKLHHLAGVVFVGQPPRGRVFPGIAPRAQEGTHRRVERERFQQVAVVAKSMLAQQIPVGRHAERIPVHHILDAAPGHDKHLGQRQRPAFSHRIGRLRQVVPDHVTEDAIGKEILIGIDGGIALGHHPVPARLAQRHGKLRIEPGAVAARAHIGNLWLRGRKLRMQQKPSGISIRLRLGPAADHHRIGKTLQGTHIHHLTPRVRAKHQHPPIQHAEVIACVRVEAVNQPLRTLVGRVRIEQRRKLPLCPIKQGRRRRRDNRTPGRQNTAATVREKIGLRTGIDWVQQRGGHIRATPAGTEHRSDTHCGCNVQCTSA